MEDFKNNVGDAFFLKAFAEAKKELDSKRSDDNLIKFFRVFATIVNNGEWVNAPITNNKLLIFNYRGGQYVSIYSSLQGRVAGDSADVIVADINKFIDVVYDNPSFMGIVVDPNKNPFYINRKLIHKLTDRKDPRVVVKDWGKGIPNYTQKDLMVQEEILDFGMQVIEDYFIKQNNFSQLEVNYGVEYFPNFVLKRNGILYFLKVDVGIVDKPILKGNDRAYYLAFSRKYNARCLYAPIVISPADEMRAKERLVLYGDAFHVSQPQIEEIY